MSFRKNISYSQFLKRTIQVIAFILLPVFVFSQNYKYHRFTIDDGLPTNYVYGVMESYDGSIWVYTEQGVCRFDGSEWDCIDQSKGLQNEDVNYAELLKDSTILLQSFRNDCSIIYDDSLYLINEYSSIFFHRDEFKLSIGGPHQDLNISKYPESIRKYFQDVNYLYEFDTLFPEYYKMQSCIIGNKLFFWDVSKIVLHDLTTGEEKRIDFKQPMTIFEISNSNIVSQYENGYIEYDTLGNVIDKYTKGQNLDDFEILRSIKDSKGNIWVGTRNSGLIFIPYNYQRSIILKSGRNANKSFKEIIQTKDGTIVAANSSGDLVKISGDSLEILFENNQINSFKNLEYDEVNEQIILFTNEINVFNNNHIVSGVQKSSNIVKSKYSSSIGSFFNCFLRGKGKKILCVFPTGYHYIENGEIIKEVYWGDNQMGNIANAYGDAENTLLRSLDNDIYVFQEGKVVDTLNIDDTRITTARFIDKGKWVLGTTNKGLQLLKNGKRTTVHHCNRVNNIDFYNGLYYVSSYSGVQVLNNDFELIEEYNSLDGITTDEVYDLVIDDNIMYVATAQGIIKINVNDRFELPEDSTPVSITHINVNGKLVNRDYLEHLSVDETNISFSFNLINYTCLEDIDYEYRLQPSYGDKWEKLPYKEIRLFSMKPGSYTLDIRAIDCFGRIHNLDDKVMFTIPKPLWKRAYFWLLVSGIVLYSFYRWYQARKRKESKAIEKKIEIETKMAELELTALRAQMNPHFVFNALGAIQYFIQTHKTEEADSFLTRFALLMRRYLESSKEKNITLENEVELLKLYTDLEKMRFEDMMNTEIIIDPELKLDHEKIPSMMIQPFVENAILHALPLRKDKGGKIIIHFQKTKEGVQVNITDNGIGLEAAKSLKLRKHKSQAMSIIKDKIKNLKSAGEYDIYIAYNVPFPGAKYPGHEVVVVFKKLQ